MLQIMRISETTFENILLAWNEGFSDYEFNFTMTIDQLVSRFGREGLSPSLSIIIFDDTKPVGLILNGVKIINGRRVAWNGGTCISPSFRGRGLSQLLMQECLKIYAECDVNIATLEVLKKNDAAITLYEKAGYRIEGVLITGHIKGEKPLLITENHLGEMYKIERVAPYELELINFYNKKLPWSSFVQNVYSGEGIVLRNNQGDIVGYALYNRSIRPIHQDIITLIQFELSPSYQNEKNIMYLLFNSVFSGSTSIWRIADFTSETRIVMEFFKDFGFEITAERYLMNKYYDIESIRDEN